MLYNYYSSQQLLHWITPSWDLAIFTQMAQAYSRFEMPIVPIKGPDFNLWGDHFHPILMLLGPVYAFFPSPMTLLVVQNGMVALSVYLTVRFAQRALGGLNGHVVGVLLAAAFGLSYGVQQAVAAQFHEVAFALPFLSLSLGHLVLAGTQQNPQRASHITHACWWAAPLAFVKEDMGVTAAMIGAIALIRSGWLREAANTLFPHASKDVPAFWPRLREVFSGWTKSRGAAEATLLMVWGLFWSYTSMNLILPIFNVNHQFDYADKVDLFGALKNPLNALQLLFTPDEKAQSLWLLLMVGAFLWVVSPLAAVALPTIAWRMLSSNSSYWLSTWYSCRSCSWRCWTCWCGCTSIVAGLPPRHRIKQLRIRTPPARSLSSRTRQGATGRNHTETPRRQLSSKPRCGWCLFWLWCSLSHRFLPPSPPSRWRS